MFLIPYDLNWAKLLFINSFLVWSSCFMKKNSIGGYRPNRVLLQIRSLHLRKSFFHSNLKLQVTYPVYTVSVCLFLGYFRDVTFGEGNSCPVGSLNLWHQIQVLKIGLLPIGLKARWLRLIAFFLTSETLLVLVIMQCVEEILLFMLLLNYCQ